MRVTALAMFAGVALVVAGCAVQPQSPQALSYRCDDGREFAVSVAPSGGEASIEIARMRFSLVADPAAAPGEQFSCSMLTLRRQGDLASVDMEGSQHFSNCRVKR